ncbi:MAG: PAS domain S-box protein [Cyanobacteria bacterium P01_E01_bin.6]
MFSSAVTLSKQELNTAIIRDLPIVSPDTPVIDAIAQMSGLPLHCNDTIKTDGQEDNPQPEKYSSCVLVVEDGHVIGMMTEQDVVRLNAQQQPLTSLTMRQVMIHPVITCRESDFTTVSSVSQLLQQHHTRHLPILNDHDQLVGLVTCDSLQHIITRQHLRLEESERQKAEARWQESDTRWQFALEGAEEGVWDWNAQTNIVFYSHQWKAMLGYDDSDVGNRLDDWDSRVHPEDKPRCYADLNKHFNGETSSYQNEHRMRCKDGSYKWVLARGKAIERTTDGQPLRVIGIHTDISDRKNTEIALQKLIEGTAATTGKDFFPALASHISEALNVSYVLVTEKVDDHLRTLAFSANGTLQPEFSYNLVQTPCEQVLQNGTFYCSHSVQQEFPNDLDLIAMEAESYLGIALQDTHSNTIGHLCILNQQPIPDPKRAEQILSVFASRAAAELERQRTTALLEELNRELETKVNARTAELLANEAQIRAIIMAIPDLLLRITRDGTCLEYIQSPNQVGDFLFIQRHIAEVLPPHLLQQQLEKVGQALDTNRLQVYEHSFQKRDQILYEEVRISPINPDEALVIVRDITDRKHADNALQESQQFIQTVLDTFPLSVFWKDRNSVYLGCNRNFLQDAGFTSVDDIVGKTDDDMPWADTQAVAYRADDFQVMASDIAKINIVETQVQTDGNQTWLETNKLPLHNLDGDVIGVLGTYQDISDRKAAEKKLILTQTAIDLAAEAIFLVRPDSSFAYVNEAACSMLGYCHEELLNLSVLDVDPEFSAQRWIDHWKTIKQCGALTLETQQETKDGRRYPVEININYLILEGEEFLFSFMREIGDRKQAEQALRESEERYRSLYRQTAVGLAHASLEGKFLEVNPRFCEMLGYSREELLSKTVTEITHTADQAQVSTDHHRLFRGDISYFFQEKRYLRKDGSAFWANTGVSLVRDAMGNPKHTLAVVHDISEQKQAENALQESQRFIQAVLDTVPIPVFWKDRDSVFLGCNHQLATALGLESTSDIIGKTDFDFSMTDIEAHAYRTDDRWVMETGHSKLGIEETLTSPDSGQRWLETHKAPLRDGEGTIVGMVGTFQDITDRKQSEDRLHQLSARLNLAVESAGIGIWDWDITNNHLVWDEQMYALYGIAPERFSNAYEAWLNGLHPNDRVAAETSSQQALEEEAEYDTEFRVIHPDGTIRFIKANAIVERNSQGKAQRMIGINYDITKLKETEVAMRRQLTTIETAIDGIAIMENDIFIYVNQAQVELFGYEHPENLIGQSWKILYPETEINRYNQEIFPILDQDRAWQGEIIATRKDGSTFAEELSMTLTEEGLLIYVCRDISERKQTEAQVHSLLNRTQLLNYISSEIRTSLNLDIILQNSVNVILKGLVADLCTFAWYQEDHPMTLKIIKEQRTSSLPSLIGSYQFDDFPILFEHILQNQVYRVDDLDILDDEPLKQFLKRLGILTYLCLPIHTLGGKIGSLQIGRTSNEQAWQDDDIDLLQNIVNQLAIAIYQAQLYEESQAKTEELKQSYKDLQDAQLQLIQSEKMSSLGQLVAGIAHEINNPVSFIYGNLEPALSYANELTNLIRLYQENNPKPPEAIANFIKKADIEYILRDFPELLASMENGATRILDIVQALRTFSHLDRADYKAVDIHENIDATLVILQSRLNGRAGNLEIPVIKEYGNLPVFECYSGLLNQVFMNLLVNAIDAIEERQINAEPNYSGCIQITTSIIPENKVMITIADNGVGMGAETQAKIFNPFFTTKPIGVGTGMGLSISYQIVTTDHQGQLECFSIPGKVTELIITLWQSISTQE